MKTRLVICALGLLLYSCGGDGGVSGPSATATFSGVVREQGSGTPISGASVTLGGITATSGQNGQFELRNVPAGAALNVTVSAPGYDAFTQSVNVQSGSNSLTVNLVRNGLYSAGNYLLYVPPNVATYRGILVVMFGGDVDTRPLVKGDLAVYQGFPLSGDVAGYRQRMIAFAQANGFAVMGGAFTSTTPTAADYSAVVNAIALAATQSSHAELGTAPLLLHGHSSRACVAYNFAVTHPERTIGFIYGKNTCTSGDPAQAASVPAFFFMGQNDPQVSADGANQMRVFVEQNRARGALWAFAVEPGAGHAQVEDQDLLFGWMSAVAALRLAPGSATLRPVSENAGWLVDPSSFAVASYQCFTGNRTTAYWLPSQQSAQNWQALVSRGSITTVLTC